MAERNDFPLPRGPCQSDSEGRLQHLVGEQVERGGVPRANRQRWEYRTLV